MAKHVTLPLGFARMVVLRDIEEIYVYKVKALSKRQENESIFAVIIIALAMRFHLYICDI